MIIQVVDARTSRMLFSTTVEPRAVDEDVARALVREMAWYVDYLRRGATDRSANPAPGNKRGGLSNIVEKTLGSISKSGTTALMGVTGPGERVVTKGLVFAATPAGDFVCGTLQLAASMNMHVFTTGEGTPYGLALAPVIKVASRTVLAERWPDLIDVDAGRIATGAGSISDVGWEIFRLILEVASAAEDVGGPLGTPQRSGGFQSQPSDLTVRSISSQFAVSVPSCAKQRNHPLPVRCWTATR